MATWIAHLRIAELLLEHLPDLDAAEFSIGSVAPDSGIPDESGENFTPPRAVTHFQHTPGVHDRMADLDFYRVYLVDLAPRGKDFSFRLAYFLHLITDNLWTMKVGWPTAQRWAAEFAADPEFIWEVKRDWYGHDHNYVRSMPACLFWRVFTTAEPASAQLDFLPPLALAQQVAHIKDYYTSRTERTDSMTLRPFIYLSKSDMDRFVDDTVSVLLRVYARFWPQPPALGDHISALDLLET